MPTARELLEQADALMRKGRGAGPVPPQEPPPEPPPEPPQEPLTHGATARFPTFGATSPRAIQREPIAPSEALASIPPAAPESPAIADLTAEIALPLAEPFDAAGPGRVEAAAADDIPTLDEAVADTVLERVDASSGLDEGADEFPLLTDAVDAEVVATIDDIAAGEPARSVAEPSAREEQQTVAEPSARGEPQVVAEPSAGEVPQVVAEPSARGEPEADAATPGPAATADGGTAIPIAGFAPLGPQPGYDIRLSVDFEDVATSASAGATARDQVAAAPSADEVPVGPEAAGDRLAEVPEADERPVGPTEMSEAKSSAMSQAPPPATSEVPPPATSEVPPPAIWAETTAGAPQAIDDARIDEAVDAIRMQVLQRIDIFTDTTLRARLGEELQPLVERASGELVAAINQHVGEWLRTYVAEVLEQEIDRWRNGQR